MRSSIERLHHAYLFSGARGVGKTTTARLLAKALNCHKSPTPTADPCRVDDPDACPSCREITESRSIDVQEIDAASNTGIDNVREAIIGTIGYRAGARSFQDLHHRRSAHAVDQLLQCAAEDDRRAAAARRLHHGDDRTAQGSGNDSFALPAV